MTELYLYQRIHLHRGRPRLLNAHIALLNEASCALFGRPYTPNLLRLEARIMHIAAAENYPQSVSGFVRLELRPDGTEQLQPAGVSLYDGYALRSISPDACLIEYEVPLSGAPTSAREAAAQLAQQLAELAGVATAIRCDNGKACLSADDAPLFAIKGSQVFTAPAVSGVRQEREQEQLPHSSRIFPSVERDITLHAIRTAGLTLHQEAFTSDDLPHFDELFYTDHRGITSLSRCGQFPFMSLTAERIAKAMESLFLQK